MDALSYRVFRRFPACLALIRASLDRIHCHRQNEIAKAGSLELSICICMTSRLHPSGWHGCGDSRATICLPQSLFYHWYVPLPFLSVHTSYLVIPVPPSVSIYVILLICHPLIFYLSRAVFLLLFSTCVAPSHYVPLLHFSVWFISDQRFVLSSYFSWQRNHLDPSVTEGRYTRRGHWCLYASTCIQTQTVDYLDLYWDCNMILDLWKWCFCIKISISPWKKNVNVTKSSHLLDLCTKQMLFTYIWRKRF